MAEQQTRVIVITVNKANPTLPPYMCIIKEDMIPLIVREILFMYRGQSFNKVQTGITTAMKMDWTDFASDKQLSIDEVKAGQYVLYDVHHYTI